MSYQELAYMVLPDTGCHALCIGIIHGIRRKNVRDVCRFDISLMLWYYIISVKRKFEQSDEREE